MDEWERYGSVVAAIKQHCDVSNPLRILDAGAGGWGILSWARAEPWIARGTVVLLDVDETRLWMGHPQSVAASGAAMPFHDRSFDVALSVDSLEHAPLDVRRAYAGELMRVANLVVVHVPADTDDGLFAGRRADAAFQEWHTHRFGREEKNTAEHLATEGHPDPYTLFPGALVQKSQPVEAWLQQMMDDYSPWRRHLSGFRYWRHFHASREGFQPPFHAALITWKA